MKKIGIITLSSSDNCGSLLQTYALQEVLTQKYNCDVKIINFNSKESKGVYNILPTPFYKHPKKLLFTFMHLKSILNQKKGYKIFRNQYLMLTENTFENCDELCNELCNEFDIVITGSDQVWNINMGDYNEAFFLPWVKKGKKISYAASLGNTNMINKVSSSRIKELLSSFSYISVREKTGKETLKKITDKEISVNLDPTLLIEQKDWEKIIGERIIKEDYIFFYSWSYPDQEMNELVRKISVEKGLKVYVINSSKWYKYRPEKFEFKLVNESGPLIFLNLMKYAKYVFVQSFHGIVFANILKKDYYFLNERDDGTIDFRANNILTLLHNENRIVHNYDDFLIATSADINYTSKELEKEKKKSFEYLDKIINDKE